MKYAKFENGALFFAPQNKGNILNYNLNVEAMTADGFKPFVETEKPNGCYKEVITEAETKIVQNWVDNTEEVLTEKKRILFAENTRKAKEAVENGFVTFKEAQFETNAQTVGDLTATMLMLSSSRGSETTEGSNDIDISGSALNMTDSCHSEALAEESITDTSLPLSMTDIITYTWLSKDDKLVTLTLEDFVTLGSLIAEYKNSIWSGKYIAFKTAIEQAETLEELAEIEINYA